LRARSKRKTAEKSGVGPGSLRGRTWKRFLRGPDPELLEQLYVPALAEAIRYDRCCAYFSSSVLAAAARGFGRLIERLISMGQKAPKPAVRLVVNEELPAEDVRALTETGDLTTLEALLTKRFKNPRDLLQKRRLAMLGWLAKEGYLEVRVGVMRRGEGIVHGKFNESATGLLANYERLEVSTCWDDPERHKEYAAEFEALWKDEHPDVHTVTLPEALRLKLIKFAPEEPPVEEPKVAVERQKAAMLWQFIAEAPYLPNGAAACDATAMVELWPHQRRVVGEVAEAWPDGRLLCDEVGLGKTIEAIFVLRRLMAGRGVRRALLLLPKNLAAQWQDELREKGGLVFPRLEGTQKLVWPDGTRKRVSGFAEALEEDVLLVSREFARLEANLAVILEAEPWDLVLLDEAHAARRRRQEEGEFNSATLLLNLLRQLQLRRKARGFLLLSATPMQTHPWEPWDLLAVLGEGGEWLAEFDVVRQYYGAIAALRHGRCDIDTARQAAHLIGADDDFPDVPGYGIEGSDVESISRALAFASPGERERLADWLRHGSPLARRMRRTTRDTLRAYHGLGLLSQGPPRRHVEDVVFDYEDAAERELYEAVTGYIDSRFEALERERPGKGFVMTIYRRRVSSSPLALQRSLERRRKGLQRVAQRYSYDVELPAEDVPEALDIDDLPEADNAAGVPAGFPDDPAAARQELAQVERLLEQVRALGARDSKRDKFFDVLQSVTDDGRPVLVFTGYWDTLDYLREALVSVYGTSIGCYSGGGGAVWDGTQWKPVTKDAITRALSRGQLRILICTDAASEGLNLQAAGALINYDLPWNPSRIEQRIGRIDRIGQRYPVVRVVNMFLKDSVDDRVYTLLRQRCGLFEHFVGAMQPVLARARRMLMERESLDVRALENTTAQVEADILSQETYLSSEVDELPKVRPPITREAVIAGLGDIGKDSGIRVRRAKRKDVFQISGLSRRRTPVSATVEELEADPQVRPLSPLSEDVRKLVEKLSRRGERLPLVIGTFRQGGFRASIAYWVAGERVTRIGSLKQLRRALERWDGQSPGPEVWQRALRRARRAAEACVIEMAQRAKERQRRALEKQVEAAKQRLTLELGRYLMCLGGGTENLNERLYRQMSRDIASARRLQRCINRLGGYPEWSSEVRRELEDFAKQLTENERRARLLGSQLDAALDDPRWAALDNL